MALSLKQLDANVRNAFTGNISIAHIPSGTNLYRFSGWDVDLAKEQVTPWWSEASGLLEFLLVAKASSLSLEAFVRNKSAVLRAWNSLFSLLIVRLNVPKEAFKGGIAFQNEAQAYMDKNSEKYKAKFTKPVYFSGGGKQLYIPDLKVSDISLVVPANVAMVTDDIDEIIDLLISYKLV